MSRKSKDKVTLGYHSDASRWNLPDETRHLLVAPSALDAVEAFAPFHRYNFSRDASRRWSNRLLTEKLQKIKNPEDAGSRGIYAEARARGLAVPKNAPSEQRPALPPNALGPILTGLGGSLALGLLAEKGIKSKEDIRKNPKAEVLARYLRRKGVLTEVSPGEAARYVEGTHLLTGKKVKGVVVDPMDSLATLAHEAGHATGTRKLMKIYGPSKLYGMFALPALGIGAATVLGDTSFKEGKDKEDRLRLARAAPLVASLPYAPVLAEEARASVRGVKMIKSMQGRKAAAKAALRLLPAFGTYAAATAGPVTASILAHRKLKKHRAARADKMSKAAGALTQRAMIAFAEGRDDMNKHAMSPGAKRALKYLAGAGAFAGTGYVGHEVGKRRGYKRGATAGYQAGHQSGHDHAATAVQRQLAELQRKGLISFPKAKQQPKVKKASINFEKMASDILLSTDTTPEFLCHGFNEEMEKISSILTAAKGVVKGVGKALTSKVHLNPFKTRRSVMLGYDQARHGYKLSPDVLKNLQSNRSVYKTFMSRKAPTRAADAAKLNAKAFRPGTGAPLGPTVGPAAPKVPNVEMSLRSNNPAVARGTKPPTVPPQGISGTVNLKPRPGVPDIGATGPKVKSVEQVLGPKPANAFGATAKSPKTKPGYSADDYVHGPGVTAPTPKAPKGMGDEAMDWWKGLKPWQRNTAIGGAGVAGGALMFGGRNNQRPVQVHNY
jgi:hypothetical protein